MNIKPGFFSSEFWVSAAALAAKIVAFLVTINAIKTTDPSQLQTVVSDVVLGVGTIWGLTHGASTYVQSRTDLKARALAQPAIPPRAPGCSV